jgi:hypothetical protein
VGSCDGAEYDALPQNSGLFYPRQAHHLTTQFFSGKSHCKPSDDGEESATMRDELIADLNRLQSSDEAADWVYENLAIKNTLTGPNADSMEASKRVLTLESGPSVAERKMDPAKDDGVVLSGRQAFIETMDASAVIPDHSAEEACGPP